MAEFDADAEASSELSLTLRLPGELAPQNSSGRLFNVLRRGKKIQVALFGTKGGPNLEAPQKFLSYATD
ncbi:hypothetical protein RUM44_003050 [Polyplax serrata]|uniref:Uncharacterized protein n=1 Tax=Polyplax serrata TaxID=468196 RepID=A0ABR1AXE9_POLSC